MPKITYTYARGAAWIDGPTKIVDLGQGASLDVALEGFSTLIANGRSYPFIDGVATFKPKDGINKMAAAKSDGSTIPLQSLCAVNIADQLEINKFVSAAAEDIVHQCKEIGEKVEKIESMNLPTEIQSIKSKLNELVDAVNSLSIRISDCEKQYDPSMMLGG